MPSLLEEKVDRLENHFKVYKSDMGDVKETLKDIRTSMLGTELNGNQGFITLLAEIKKEVQAMKDKQILLEDNMNNVKFVSRGIITALIGFFIWLFTNK